jgi:hypothetical protein
MTTDSVEDFLAHYGVKGMRWGIRKTNEAEGGGGERKGLSEGQKKALKIGLAGAAITGAAVTTALLAKNGKLPVAQLSSAARAAGNARSAARLAASPNVYRSAASKAASGVNSAQNAREGARYASSTMKNETKKLFDDDTWNTSVKKLMDDIAEAHRDETKYMKTSSSKSGIGYDPLLNEYTPESRARRA